MSATIANAWIICWLGIALNNIMLTFAASSDDCDLASEVWDLFE